MYLEYPPLPQPMDLPQPPAYLAAVSQAKPAANYSSNSNSESICPAQLSRLKL